MNINLLIAWRYLVTKQKEPFISIINIFSILGIALGVATLIIVMSVMNGYEKELIHKILGLKGHITITNRNGLIEEYNSLVNTIQANEKIKLMTNQIAPVLEGQAMAMSSYGFSGVIIKAMNQSDLQAKEILSTGLITGSIDDHGLIIGHSLSDDLKIVLNSNLKLIVPQITSTIIGSIPRMKTYKISGLFDVGMYEYNKGVIFMPLSFAQILLNVGDKVSHIEIFTSDISYVEEVTERLRFLLGIDYQVVDWKMSNQTLVQALRVERNVMFLILSLIIVIATFNILSSLTILVKDKAKSIAILRTIGFNKARVIKIFCIYGFVIGLSGTILGTIFGVIFALNIETIRVFLEEFSGKTIFDPVVYFLTTLPSELSWQQVIQVVGISLIFSLLATIYPARKIAKISPAELLKYE